LWQQQQQQQEAGAARSETPGSCALHSSSTCRPSRCAAKRVLVRPILTSRSSSSSSNCMCSRSTAPARLSLEAVVLPAGTSPRQLAAAAAAE
jgi:hypothetical protein